MVNAIIAAHRAMNPSLSGETHGSQLFDDSRAVGFPWHQARCGRDTRGANWANLVREIPHLAVRLAALSIWCDSFNIGFAGVWVKDDAAMAQETREVLQDFFRIAQVNKDDEDLTERENELNYIEVIEYARRAAITVYTQNIDYTPESDHDNGLPAEHDIH